MGRLQRRAKFTQNLLPEATRRASMAFLQEQPELSPSRLQRKVVTGPLVQRIGDSLTPISILIAAPFPRANRRILSAADGYQASIRELHLCDQLRS